MARKAAVTFSYEVLAECSTTKARVGQLNLPHKLVNTPVFMPVSFTLFIIAIIVIIIIVIIIILIVYCLTNVLWMGADSIQ